MNTPSEKPQAPQESAAGKPGSGAGGSASGAGALVQTDERPPKPRPAPPLDPDTEAYWQAAHNGKLLVQRCAQCDHVQLYGRAMCVACGGGDVSWEEASGRGTVYSFTVIRQNYVRPFREWIPYVVALVDLEEGPRVMTNIVNCAPEDVAIGMPVTARFEDVSEEAGIALFEPAD